MEHHHNSGHDHSHSHAPTSFGAAFAIGAALNVALVLAQFGFGYLSNSLALISDAVHNLSDVVGLLLAWGASWAGRRSVNLALGDDRFVRIIFSEVVGANWPLA